MVMNRIKHLWLFLVLLTPVSAFAQGTLQFNQVLTISNTPVTVPAGKVWKISAVYGKPTNQCTSDMLNIWGSPSYHWAYKAKGFQLDGNTVFVQIMEAQFKIHSNSSCSNLHTTRAWADTDGLNFRNEVGSQTAADLQAMLPFWVEADRSVNTLSSQQFISLIEFNIVP
jgi:hypothetical protein